MNNHSYNKALQPYAKDLRGTMTKAEACLWKYALKSRQMKGYSFRRQRPILNFIADFACLELQLIIEVDGYTHSLDETITKDAIKQEELEKEGYSVLRFSDRDVLTDMSNVILRIESFIEELELNVHPLPPPAGDTSIP